MPSDSTLTLFIPDLFGFQSTLSTLSADEISQLPEIKLPIIEKWFSRGSLEKLSVQEDTAFFELGLDNKKPYAAFSLLSEKTLDIDINKNSYWLRADPVNLQPDRDTALLAGHKELALTQDEAGKLVDQINEHFIDEPWQLFSFAPHRWYLRLNKSSDLNTTPLAKVLGEDISPFSPTGDDADYWFKIINELQMLIHGSNVNFERESRNMWTANSVWLWGGGCLPEAKLNSSYDKIITNNTVFKGVGYHCGLDVLPLIDNDISENIKANNNFVVLEQLSEQVQRRDLYTFVETLNKIESDFLLPCHELLMNKTVGKIKIITDVGTLTVTKKQLGRWWKRIRSFSSFNYE
ncbi:MAG: hypothetical protein QM484_06545 [Woeseiaceae bacterium]